MDSETVVSEPISAHHRAFAKQKSASLTVISPKNYATSNKYNMRLDTLDGNKLSSQDNINNIMGSSSTTSRRRKGASLSGMRVSRNGDTKELRTAVQDREAVIQNLRIQLCLGKLPRPTGPPLDDQEKPVAEKKLQQLKSETDNKKIKIKNIKRMLEKLDVTDNIDIRIRQAELEYALGREELQLLSIVEETRALQARLEKSKPEFQTLYNILNCGNTLSLHAVNATTGRWSAQIKPDHSAFYVEWALEGDGLYKGDRILEINGKLINCKTKEDFQSIVGNSGKCQMVVIRRKATPIPQKELNQEKENNLRLQHRISYLEEQVKELLNTKELHDMLNKQQQHQQQQQQQQQQKQIKLQNQSASGHVTSISISSPSSALTTEKPLIYQRGNYITTLVGGKPIELSGADVTDNYAGAHVTKTLIRENTQTIKKAENNTPPTNFLPRKSLSSSKISINSAQHPSSRADSEHRREKELELQTQARSVEHLNHYNNGRREISRSKGVHTMREKNLSDMRSVKSLNFDGEQKSRGSGNMPLEVHTLRPIPPKKPQRLSLQRAQSLQTVELHPGGSDSERKRALKRAHMKENNKLNTLENVGGSTGNIFSEKCPPLHTSSLGRHKQFV